MGAQACFLARFGFLPCSEAVGASASGAATGFLGGFLVFLGFLAPLPLFFFEELDLSDLAALAFDPLGPLGWFFLGLLGLLGLDAASSFTSFANGLHEGNEEDFGNRGVSMYRPICIRIRKSYTTGQRSIDSTWPVPRIQRDQICTPEIVEMKTNGAILKSPYRPESCIYHTACKALLPHQIFLINHIFQKPWSKWA